MGKGALRPFFKGHSLKKEKEHEKKGSGQNAFAFCHTPTVLPPNFINPLRDRPLQVRRPQP